MKIEGLFKLKSIGADTIFPILMYEFGKNIEKSDLAEVYTLLHEAQALYITRCMAVPDAYYDQREPMLMALLKKYGMAWVMIHDELVLYVMAFLERIGFKTVENGLLFCKTVPKLDHYETHLLQASITYPDTKDFMVSKYKIVDLS